MSTWCKNLADDSRFQGFIILLILFNAFLLGMETDPYLDEHSVYGKLLDTLEGIILAIFVIEIAIRMVAFAPNVMSFFKDPWNVFDFTVVAVSLLPVVGPLGVVARMARVLRVVRLLAFSQQLKLIVNTLLRSIPSMGHVVMLLTILVYTYAVLGITLFRDDRIRDLDRMNETVAKLPFGSEEREKLEAERDKLKANANRWGNVGLAAWSMFQTLTFENWVGLQDPLIQDYWWTPLFFLSFILLGVFVAMNLFVAVVMNNLEEAKAEQRAEPHVHDTFTQLMNNVENIKDQLTELEAALQAMRDAPKLEAASGASSAPSGTGSRD
jgi:voltage-gated sodium channel